MSSLCTGYMSIKCLDVWAGNMINGIVLTSLNLQSIVLIICYSLQECLLTWTSDSIQESRKCIVNCNMLMHPCFCTVQKLHPQQGVVIGVSQLGWLCSLRIDGPPSPLTLGLILYWPISDIIHFDIQRLSIRRPSGTVVQRILFGPLVFAHAIQVLVCMWVLTLLGVCLGGKFLVCLQASLLPVNGTLQVANTH